MEPTPSRSPLGAFVRSPLGVRGGGKVELYYHFEAGWIGSVGKKTWQVPHGSGIGMSLPINMSSDGKSWSRDILMVTYADGIYKRWERVPICAGTTNSYCVAAYSNGSPPSIEIFHSTDLKTWTRTYYLSTSAKITAFAWSPLASKFVAICDDNYAITSSDGANWSRDASGELLRYPFWNPITGYFYSWYFYSCLRPTANDVTAPPLRSAGGITWSTASTMPSPFIISDGIGIGDHIATYSPFFPFWFVGRPPSVSATIWTSFDGLSWTASHTATDDLSFCAGGGGVLVAGHPSGSDTKVYYSSDGGSSWSTTTITGFRTENASTSARYYCTYAGGKFWLSGFGGGTTLYSSTDGATWKRLVPDELSDGSKISTYP